MANLLTAIRLLLVAPVAWAFSSPGFISAELLLGLLVLAIASDYFDGKVARAMNTASPRGMLFDHGTDFLFVTAGLAGASVSATISPLLPVLITIAFTQYVLDSYFLFRQKQLRMSLLGRWNGIFYFVPLIALAVSRLEMAGELRTSLEACTKLLGFLLMISTVASIIDRAIAPFNKKHN